jgi:hypothetical protein
MTIKRIKIRARRGTSLIGIMIAIVITLTALIGTTNFRYYTVLEARKAAAQTTAARIALMLCESWRGIKGDANYDLAAHLGSEMTITATASIGPDKPDDFTLLGKYKIVLDKVNGVNYYVTLSWKDVKTGLRALNVVVAWAQRDQGQISINDTDKSFTLTTYAL